jgi:hypothetical protein
VSETVWEQGKRSPIYLDSAYKQLLREDFKANALRNRTKALNNDQEHLLKQIENNEVRVIKLNSIKNSHSLEVRKVVAV